VLLWNNECLRVTTELRHSHNRSADPDLHVWADLDHLAGNLKPGADRGPPRPLVISTAGNNVGIVDAYKADPNEHFTGSECAWSNGVPLKHVRSAEATEEHAAVLWMIDHAARLRPTRRIWQPSSFDVRIETGLIIQTGRRLAIPNRFLASIDFCTLRVDGSSRVVTSDFFVAVRQWSLN
jgi:hypothetical protein